MESGEIMCARLLVTRGPCEGNPIFFSFSPFAPSLACREDEAEKSLPYERHLDTFRDSLKEEVETVDRLFYGNCFLFRNN